jgi:hypothetical protein
MKKCFVITIISLVILANGQKLAELNNTDIKSSSFYKAETDSVKIPRIISYQGKLVDSIGRPVYDGSYVMVFSLYKDSSGTGLFWRETQTVTTNNGLFNIFLGSLNHIDSITSDNCYLGIRVFPSLTEMSPRQKIVSVPFAYRSDNSDKIGGANLSGLDNRYVNVAESAAISNIMIQANAITTTKIADTNVTLLKIQRAGAMTGQVIKWTGSAWAPRPDSGVPQGPAGGDLTGNYPNPTIALNAVTSDKILDGTINAGDIRDTTIMTAKIKDTAVTMTKISQAGASTGQVIKWTGSAWAPRPDSGVPQGPAGGALAGTYPNPTLADDSVTTMKIKDGAVTNTKLGVDAVTTDKISDNTITREDVSTNFKAPYSDTSDYVRNINVTYVDSARIAANAHKLQGKDTTALSTKFVDENQANSISNAMLQNNAVTSAKIQDSTIARADVIRNFKAPLADTADYARAVSVAYVDSTRISVNAYNAYKLQGKDTLALDSRYVNEGQAYAISDMMIKDSAITSIKISSNAISTAQIKDSTITSEKIQDSTITGVDISPQFILLDTTLMGIAQIDSGYNQVTVFNTRVTNNSLIFLTIGPTLNSIDKSIKVKGIYPPNSFIVGTISNNSTSIKIPFQYVIIPRP